MLQLLDCTLRDGAHVNNGKFGNNNIKKIAKALTQGNIDYVELGFLRNVNYDSNVSYYPTIEKAYDILSEIPNKSNVEYALMARADEYDVDKLTKCNGRINLIRIAFYYDYLEEAVRFAKKIMDKGYKVTFNLINTPGSSIDGLKKVLKYANEINPEVLTIVDTFGVLQKDELNHILHLYDNELNSNIKIGLHVHENLSLAFFLAQHFLGTVNESRDVIVDGSLMGIGRIPGNLCIELIADYLNDKYGKNYDLNSILEVISSIIVPIKSEIPWGYSTAYFLSAKYRVHRSYSEYLIKLNISFEKINCLLSRIDADHALKFDKNYIDFIISQS